MADKVIPKLQIGDETTDRMFDRLRAVVNPALKQLQAGTTVTGSRGGNAALASLLTALAAAGIIVDKTS